MRGEGVGLPARVKQDTFTPSRRSCTQTGTGRLRGLTRPSDTNLRGPRLSEAKGTPPCPETPPNPREGKRTRLDQPTRKPSPSSHLPARDAHSRARPPVRPGPAIRGAPSPRTARRPRSSPPRSQTHQTPAPTEHALNAPAPAGPRARSRPSRPSPRRARSLARTSTVCASA